MLNLDHNKLIFQGCKPYEGLAFLNHKTPSCKTTCTNANYKTTYEDDRFTGFTYYSLDKSVEQIQTDIMTNGPIQASYRVFEDFMTYEEGMIFKFIIKTVVNYEI